MMLDHIYLADRRGYVFYDLFDVVIHADHLDASGPLVIKSLTPHTTYLNTSVGNIDRRDQVLTYIHGKIKTLIFSETYTEACALYLYYLIHVYHFSKDDIYHIFGNIRYPDFLTNEVRTILTTKVL